MEMECNGKRYEELFNEIPNVRKYILSKEDCFDVLDPLDKDECKKLVEKADYYDSGAGGKPLNRKKAYKYYREAALNGHVWAMIITGDYLVQQESYEDALRWFVSAAIYGHPFALLNISGMLSMGWGVPKNITLADKWEEIANDIIDSGT